jgi:hypothetical protein
MADEGAAGVRIRQVRPEFFTDAIVARLPADVRLLYIGLWIVADDAGWLDWDPAQIGALLFPFESVRRREAFIVRGGESLVKAGRMTLHDCGCAQIPTLPRHQRISGKQSFSAREAHGKHLPLTRTQSSLTDSPVTVGNGNGRERNVTVGNVTVGPGPLKERLGSFSDITRPGAT